MKKELTPAKVDRRCCPKCGKRVMRATLMGKPVYSCLGKKCGQTGPWGKAKEV